MTASWWFSSATEVDGRRVCAADDNRNPFIFLGPVLPTLSEHRRVLVDVGLVRAKRIKGWTMYKRDEQAISAFKKAIREM